MKKWILTSLASLLILIVSFSGCVEEKPPIELKTIYVDDGGGADYTIIQDAIDAANEGDTVFVYTGTYNENLVINKSINLIGENKDDTIIVGDGDNDGIYIGANQINVSGFTVNSGIGTRAVRIVTSFNAISDNNLSDNSWGIYMENAPNNVISENIIGNNIEGIQMWNSDECSISENIIYSNNSHSNFGVYSDSCNHTIFSDNTVFTSKRGIQFISSDYLTISGNTIHSNSNTGLHLADACEYATISNNNIYSNGHGIFFISSSNNTIYSNNFINNTEENAYELNECDNSWDYNSIGNYWSDYNGTDSNGDDIGDTPYIIPGDGVTDDRYPLMNSVDI